MSDRSHFVYRAFDAEGRLLYIGCTGNLEQRRANHRTSSLWYPYAASFRASGPYTRDVALAIEKAAIDSEKPFFNVTKEHRRGWLTWSRIRAQMWSQLENRFQLTRPDGQVDIDQLNALGQAVESRTLALVPKPVMGEDRLNLYLEARAA